MAVNYSRFLERLAILPSKQALPYVDATQFDTAVAIVEGKAQDLFEYDDQVINRKFKVTLSWVLETQPRIPSPYFPESEERLWCKLSFTDGGKLVELSFILVPDGSKHLFQSSVLIPTETSISGTSSITMFPVPVGVEVQASQQGYNVMTGDPRFVFDLKISYMRLQDRPFATKAETPYIQRVVFQDVRSANEGQEEVIYRTSEGVRGKNLVSRFSWRHQRN